MPRGKTDKVTRARRTAKQPKRQREPELDLDLLEECAWFQMTHLEAACFLKCDPSTLDRRIASQTEFGSYVEYFAVKSRGGLASLRRRQFQKALAGDNVMLIWVGKQYLKQSERGELNIQTTNAGTVAASIRRLMSAKKKKRFH